MNPKPASVRNTAAAKSGHQKYLLPNAPAADGTATTMLTATYCVQKANATQRQPITAAMMGVVFVFIIL